jgi:ABC-2 type transport system ATP-binding protein
VPSQLAIEVDSLGKRYGDTVAVTDLSLEVSRGEIFGFLGPNGAGKSTTIDLLVGFAHPTAGTVRVFGHDPLDAPTAVRERVGALPDDRGVYPNLTGREQLASAIDVAGTTDDPDALLDRVGLDSTARERPAGEYSTGMRGRLLLAVALVGDPDLLILDEPSLGLDPVGVREIRSLLRAEAERGTAVFLSSHRLREVEAVCDRVGILADGRLRAVAPVSELRSRLPAGDRLHLHTESRPTDRTLSALSEIDGVTDVLDSDGDAGVDADVDADAGAGADVGADAEAVSTTAVTTVVCADPAAKPAVVRHLDDSAGVTDFQLSEPTLEAVFDAHTGTDTETETTADSEPSAPEPADSETVSASPEQIGGEEP